eukprot:6188071-Pleurochrysis_carterae.AAC.1
MPLRRLIPAARPLVIRRKKICWAYKADHWHMLTTASLKTAFHEPLLSTFYIILFLTLRSPFAQQDHLHELLASTLPCLLPLTEAASTTHTRIFPQKPCGLPRFCPIFANSSGTSIMRILQIVALPKSSLTPTPRKRSSRPPKPPDLLGNLLPFFIQMQPFFPAGHQAVATTTAR